MQRGQRTVGMGATLATSPPVRPPGGWRERNPNPRFVQAETPACQPNDAHERHVQEEGVKLLDDVTIREFLGTAYPRIVAAVSMVAGDRATAEDAVQEALARAWERSS